MNEHELLDAWLDGKLSGEELTAFEAKLQSDPELAELVRCQRAIDASLARTFAVPPEPGVAVVEHLLREARPAASVGGAQAETARATETTSGGGLLDWWPLASVAAAAVLLFVFNPPGGDTAPVGDVATKGNLVRGEPLPGDGGAFASIETPNLERLYDRIAGGPWRAAEKPPGSCGPPTEEPQDVLETTIANRHGGNFRLRSDAPEHLYGPFSSAEWPGATVLSGYPKGAEGPMAVLVAENDDQFRCCVRMEMPQNSNLKFHTWQVGRLVLTEITPLPEPGLLQYFEAR